MPPPNAHNLVQILENELSPFRGILGIPFLGRNKVKACSALKRSLEELADGAYCFEPEINEMGSTVKTFLEGPGNWLQLSEEEFSDYAHPEVYSGIAERRATMRKRVHAAREHALDILAKRMGIREGHIAALREIPVYNAHEHTARVQRELRIQKEKIGQFFDEDLEMCWLDSAYWTAKDDTFFVQNNSTIYIGLEADIDDYKTLVNGLAAEFGHMVLLTPSIDRRVTTNNDIGEFYDVCAQRAVSIEMTEGHRNEKTYHDYNFVGDVTGLLELYRMQREKKLTQEDIAAHIAESYEDFLAKQKPENLHIFQRWIEGVIPPVTEALLNPLERSHLHGRVAYSMVLEKLHSVHSLSVLEASKAMPFIAGCARYDLDVPLTQGVNSFLQSLAKKIPEYLEQFKAREKEMNNPKENLWWTEPEKTKTEHRRTRQAPKTLKLKCQNYLHD